jgi:integrative and conjugative element protein (TIGR02256 family)
MILRSGIRLVEVADDVVDTIQGFSRSPEISREAGGILLGSYRGPHVQIERCTTPLPADRRFWNLFDRKDLGHGDEALRRWRDSGRTMTFVGEWHTHPEPVPSPSFLDRTTWRRIAKRHKFGPIVFVIRGISGWWWGIMQHATLSPLSLLQD